MARTGQARRYAQAVFQIARERGELDRWLSDLETLSGLGQDNVFVRALETPGLAAEHHARLLSEWFPNLGPMAVNLVCLLLQKRQVGIIPAIFEEYRNLVDGHLGILRADVVTAVPLDDEDVRRLAARVGSLTGKQVTIRGSVDPSIIGGIVARFGGKLLDGSTRSRLEALKKEIAQVPG